MVIRSYHDCDEVGVTAVLGLHCSDGFRPTRRTETTTGRLCRVSVNVLWFRRDLRLEDHHALAAASAEGPVVPLYVIDPDLWNRSGAPRQAFLGASLQKLNASLGGTLVLRCGRPADLIPAFVAEVGAHSVFVTGDHSPFGRRRDDEIERKLRTTHHHLVRCGSNYAVEPGQVRKSDGTPYAVFTPFSKAWRQVGWPRPIAVPDVTWRGSPEIRCDGYPPAPAWERDVDGAGEQAAHQRWASFRERGLNTYDADRNSPAMDGTSRLGPHLRFGTIHPRLLLADLQGTRAHDVFANELAWRDFYADVLWHRPESAWKNLQPKMNAMPCDSGERAEARFRSWCAGETGFPIVDAGMRQLSQTGFVHNRLRMVVASFLIKDLHLPWQWGARHFMQHLTDGDIASNNHGWQWTAGTGTDAAPYFRVFNPVSQSERFDPDGTYIRRFVPELAEVSDREIHAPWASKRGIPLGYVAPMVDHAVERDEALRRYALVSASRAR